MRGFNKKDFSTLDFVISCLFMQAITFDEFKEFFYLVIKKNEVEKIPIFIWDILDLKKEDISTIYNIIGFVPHSDMSASDRNAIYSIAAKRFGYLFDKNISEENIINFLKDNPDILIRFKETFPFIKLNF
ncbi:hypothetical protein ACIRXL_08460 [Avibacterium paragallinarum]|uniref:hypothetical protein n=1 Tax=Avibacterium paragallinarum TaxID=728 RepID=UPI0021F7A20F|nr:hypothetical protein [Avibacterium paragallinarum]UXN35323.1 hypothetical protein N8E86_03685 [Avibacterium paragallinarum]